MRRNTFPHDLNPNRAHILKELLGVHDRLQRLRARRSQASSRPESSVLYDLAEYAAGQLPDAVAAAKDNSSINLAWHLRNLLETAILTQFVCDSDGNEKRFLADLKIDENQFHAALLRLLLQGDPTYSRPPRLTSYLDENQQWLIAQGLDSETTYLRVSTLAEKYERSEEYVPLFKICSKLSHPTGFAIQTRQAVEWSGLVTFLAWKCDIYAQEIYLRLAIRLSPSEAERRSLCSALDALFDGRTNLKPE